MTLDQEKNLDELKSLIQKLNISLHTEEICKLNDSFDLIFNMFVKEDIPRNNGIEKNGWALAWPLFYTNKILNSDIYQLA